MSLHNEQVIENSLDDGTESSKLLTEAKTLNTKTPVNVVKIQKAQSYSAQSNGPTLTALTPASSSAQALITHQSLDGGGGCSTNKPVLIRQDRTTNSSYLASPQLSTLGTSEETSEDEVKTISYQLIPSGPTKCRTCNLNERRASVSPSTVINNASMLRCSSKESISRLSPSSALLQSSAIPPVYVTGSPINSSRVIRQSSQPESSTLSCSMQQTSSLRQLRDVSDPIAGIATETLRVMKNCYNLF